MKLQFSSGRAVGYSIGGGAATGAETWADYLDPDERLLWEGAPATGRRIRGTTLLFMGVGGIFILFAVAWTVIASIVPPDETLGGYFRLFGIPFGLIGLGIAVGGYFWDGYSRRRTRYALTDRRAIIATSALGRSLKSYPIDSDTRLDYQPGPEATIWFAEEVTVDRRGNRFTVRQGFELIPEGDKVYRLMRQVQRRDSGAE